MIFLKKKDKSQYWLNPNKKKYCDMSIAIPILNKKFLFRASSLPKFCKNKIQFKSPSF